MNTFLELLENETHILNEVSRTVKKVIRKGKVIKKKSCPKGYKLVGNACVKMNKAEAMKRSRGAKRGGRKGKAARIRTRAKSNRIRRNRGM